MISVYLEKYGTKWKTYFTGKFFWEILLPSNQICHELILNRIKFSKICNVYGLTINSIQRKCLKRFKSLEIHEELTCFESYYFQRIYSIHLWNLCCIFIFSPHNYILLNTRTQPVSIMIACIIIFVQFRIFSLYDIMCMQVCALRIT